MSVSIKQLVSNDQIAGTSAATTDTLYTASNVTAQLNAATAYNGHASAVTVSFYILPTGIDATAVDPVAVQTINNGESAIIADLIGHVIPKNGTLEAFAGTTAVIRVSASGIEIA